MTFLAPLMLAGAAAVSIPLALHFFYRARYKPKPWAAMRFLRHSIEQTSRRLKFQEWVLLALRCMLIALIAFALARPASSTLSGVGRGDSVDAVFLIDTSMSMAARDGEADRLERAKAAARRILDQLPANSTVQVVEVSDRARVIGPRSPGNFDQARVLIDELRPTHLGTDFLPAFSEALAALDRGSLPNKEIYLFSDLQASGWERQSEALRARCAELDARSTIYLVRCGGGEPSNVTLVGLIPRGGIPHSGTRASFSAMLRNSGTKPIRDLTVTLEVDGRPLEKESASVDEIGPGEVKAVPLTAKLDAAGQAVLRARVSPDDLPSDNVFDAVVGVRDQVRVLVIDGDPEPDLPEEASSFFLMHALRPVPEFDRAAYHIQPRMVRPEEASPALLTDQHVCILANVPLSFGGATRPLSDAFLERLERFVREGGGLIIGGGPQVDPSVYNEKLLGGGVVDVLPARLAGLIEADADAPMHPGPDGTDLASYLAGFREAPLSQIGLAEVFRALGTAPTEGRVLMRYADGRPMVLSRRVGDGEVILLTTSLGIEWTDWPIGARENSYLPFLHLSLSHLVQRSSTGFNVTAGEPLYWRPPDNQLEYSLVRPDGSRERLGKPGGSADERLALRFAETDLAGVYRIVPEGDGEAVAFAVTPDVTESENLDAFSDEQIDGLLGFRPVHLSAQADLSELAGEYRLRREWTLWALLALFVLTFGETFWAWFCGRPVA